MLVVKDNRNNVPIIRQQIISRLQEMADPETARTAQRFFPKKIDCFGVRAADLRSLSREIFRRVESEWSTGQALELAEGLFDRQELETRTCGLLVLGFFQSGLSRPHLDKIKSWLKKGYLDNWALIDTLSLEVLGPYFLRNPGELKIISSLALDDSPYLRRTALVSLVKLARDKKNLSLIFRTIRFAVGKDISGDLVAKAAGWLLREAGKSDPGRLEKFLLTYGRQLPRVTVRYALEKFSGRRREHLMKITKINLSRRHYDQQT